MSETAVNSFVIRFVQEDPAAVVWRGFIRHVQTHEETHFTHMQEAVRFMAQYVAVEQGEDAEIKRSADVSSAAGETPALPNGRST